MASPTYDTQTKNARMDATAAQVSGGSLEILAADNTVLATIDLQTPAFGNAAAGVITLAGVPLSDLTPVAGTAAKAQFKDSGGTARITGLTVGTSGSGAAVIIDTTTISAGQAVTCTACTLTHGG